MAKRTQVILEDDLDGGPADKTVTFALDGKTYELDLNSKNAKKLSDALQPFVDKARKVGTKGKAGSRTTVRSDSKAIRAWGEANGFSVPQRGRLPANLVEAFEKANR